MLITAIEKERKKLFEKGIEKGKVEAVKVMLSKGMTVSLISEITGLAEEDILKLKSQISLIHVFLQQRNRNHAARPARPAAMGLPF